jgi:hypothetical protein
LSLPRGCADNFIIKWDITAEDWGCEADADTGGSLNAFSTIAADSGPSAVADTSTDTFTIVGGTNISTISADDPESVTINVDDVYVLTATDTMTGDLNMNAGSGDSPKVAFSPGLGTVWDLFVENTGDDLQIEVTTASVETVDLVNTGAGTVNLTMDGDLTVSGNDIIMATNTAGQILAANGTDFSPATVAGDLTSASAGNLQIGPNAVGPPELATNSVTSDELSDSASDEVCANLDGAYTVCNTAATPDELDVKSDLAVQAFSYVVDTPTTAFAHKAQHAPRTACTFSAVSCSTDTGTTTIQLNRRALTTPNARHQPAV